MQEWTWGGKMQMSSVQWCPYRGVPLCNHTCYEGHTVIYLSPSPPPPLPPSELLFTSVYDTFRSEDDLSRSVFLEHLCSFIIDGKIRHIRTLIVKDLISELLLCVCAFILFVYVCICVCVLCVCAFVCICVCVLCVCVVCVRMVFRVW